MFNISRQRVIDWRRNEVGLREQQAGRKRKGGGGNKVTCLGVEDQLKLWMQRRREAGACLTGKDLTNECLRLHRQHGNEDFKASSGWLRQFMKRNHVSLRRSTRVTHNLEYNMLFGTESDGFTAMGDQQMGDQQMGDQQMEDVLMAEVADRDVNIEAAQDMVLDNDSEWGETNDDDDLAKYTY